MKLLLGLFTALLLSTAAQAGTFSMMAWTDDSNTGIAAGQTNAELPKSSPFPATHLAGVSSVRRSATSHSKGTYGTEAT